MTRSKNELKHYLVTLPLSSRAHLHAYLMTDDDRALNGLMNKMIDIVEKEGVRLVAPIILATPLGSSADIVREIVSRQSPEAKHAIETATDFHVSIFMMSDDYPDDARLMELH